MAKAPTGGTWTSFSIKRAPILIGERGVLAKWTGDEPSGGWVLHYAGHPLVSMLPKSLQPNGRVGHQYLACVDDAAAIARYGELIAAARRAAPKLELHGPEPESAKVGELAKKNVNLTVPDENGMFISLERATALHGAESALNGDQEEAALACVHETAGGKVVVSSLSGACHVTTNGGDILFVGCPKSASAKALANALAGKGPKEDGAGTLRVTGKELVLMSAHASGSGLAAELKQGAAHAIACKPGSYAISTGYDYPVQVLRLRAS